RIRSRRIAATCTSLQSPPRAVLTPRAVKARAMPRRLLTPLMGRALAANASAASLRAFMDALRAAAGREPPRLTPRRLAAASGGRPRPERLADPPHQEARSHRQKSLNRSGAISV